MSQVAVHGFLQRASAWWSTVWYQVGINRRRWMSRPVKPLPVFRGPWREGTLVTPPLIPVAVRSCPSRGGKRPAQHICKRSTAETARRLPYEPVAME